MLLFAWSFFAKSNYRNVDNIHPALLQEPIQTEPINKDVIKFNKGGFDLELTPLYDFEINALIVSKYDYASWGFNKEDSIYPVDFLLIWGDNVKTRAYQSNSLTFSQDSRQGRWMWFGDLKFNNHQAANDHLIIRDSRLEEEIRNLSIGDQIKIKGRLVKIYGRNTSGDQTEDPEINLVSSTVGTDSGPGACEIIDVTELEVLERGNPAAHSLFSFSFYSLLLLIIGNVSVFLIRILSPNLS